MKRKFLFSFYETPQGKLLQILEKKYLKRSITVSCNQAVLQMGGLDWEDEFIDFSFYRKYYILDSKGKGCKDATRIKGKSYRLPIQSECIDLVILPHLLEFDANRFQTMREIERILKPEGELIILNLNPLNVWVRLSFLWNKKMSYSWKGSFIARSRITDWLKLLNFEIKNSAEFTIDSILTEPDGFKFGYRSFSSTGFAVRAVKRQFTLIPLTPVKMKSRDFAPATSGLKLSSHGKKDD